MVATPKTKRRKPLQTSILTRRLFESMGYRVAFVERCVSRTPPGFMF